MKDLFPVDFKGLLRGLFFSIIGTALILCFLFIAYGLVFNLVTSNPERIKSVFAKSSLYEDLPAVVYDEIAQEREGSLLEISLKDPEVRRIALEVYDPSFAQDSVENLIDGLYGWLNGASQKPQFSIGLTKQNQEFAAKLGEYVEKRTAKLPPCGPEDIKKLDETNVFKAKCWPSHISPEAAGREAEEIIAGVDDSVLNTRFTEEDLKTADGQPLHKEFAGLPQSFALVKTIPIALIIFALVLIIIIFQVSKDRVSALKRISRLLLFSGILTILVPITVLTASKALFNVSADETSQVENIARTLIEEFMYEAGKIYYVMGILLILAAIGTYLYVRKIQSNSDKVSKKKT